MDFEIKLIEFLQGGRTPFFDVSFQVISMIGSYVGAVALVLLFLFTKHRRGYAFWFLFTYGFAYLVQSSLKVLIARDRPFNVSDSIMNIGDVVTSYSMPSGHVVCATLIAVFLGAYLFSFYKSKGSRAMICLALIIYVGLVALSRMYLGKHFLTDTLAGMALGAVFGTLGLILMWQFNKRRKKNETSNDNS